MKTTTMTSANDVTSKYAKVVDRDSARSRLRAAAAEEVARLEAAVIAGWDVAKDLERAKAYLHAFS